MKLGLNPCDIIVALSLSRKKHIYFFIKGGGKYGWGHAVRSVQLATKIRNQVRDDISIKFFLDGELDINQYINIKGFEVFSVSINKDLNKESNYWENHDKAKMIITDFLEITFEYQEFLKSLADVLVCFDDSINNNYCADVLICGQLFNNYNNCIPNSYGTKYYLGPKYFIMKEGFRKYNLKKKMISSKINNIVISLGGGEQNNQLYKIAKILDKLNLLTKATFIVGINYSKKSL